MGEVKGEIEGGIKPTGALCLKDFRHFDGRDEASCVQWYWSDNLMHRFYSQAGNILFPVWEFI